jgi:hypothetical protein
VQEEKKRILKKKERTRRTRGHKSLSLKFLSFFIAERNQKCIAGNSYKQDLLFLRRQFHLIEARPNAFVQNSLVSPALLCNKDTKENLVRAFTFKENVCMNK